VTLERVVARHLFTGEDVNGCSTFLPSLVTELVVGVHTDGHRLMAIRQVHAHHGKNGISVAEPRHFQVNVQCTRQSGIYPLALPNTRNESQRLQFREMVAMATRTQ
jgi:hypothetical protein